MRLGLDIGTLFSWAFSQEFLSPAITGIISHEEWSERVKAKLTHLYGEAIANQLITAWQAASWEINTDFLRDLKQLTSTFKLVLVTNATSRLDSDLSKAGLESTFDAVVNSSKIHVAKPELKFFGKALSIAGSQATHSIFIDDSRDNINAARSIGIDSIHHKNTGETLAFIQRQYIENLCNLFSPVS